MVQGFAEDRAGEFATKFVGWLLSTVQLAFEQQIQTYITKLMNLLINYSLADFVSFTSFTSLPSPVLASTAIG